MTAETAHDMAEKKPPVVSVIIPTFNRANMVGRTLQSALVQTFADIEVIVVDDGSSDDTHGAVQAHADDRVKYVRHEVNRGANAARNTGARMGQGKYLTFLDSDAVWMPTKLEKQVETFTVNPHALQNLGVVLTGWASVIESTHETRKAIEGRPQGVGRVYDAVFLRKIGSGYMTGLIRRDTFFNAGLFDEDLPASQDWDLCLRLAKISDFDTVNEVLYIDYRHSGPRVHTRSNALRANLVLFEKYRDDFSRYNHYHARLRARVAAWYLGENRKREALQEAWTAIRLCPWRFRTYTYLALAGLSEKAYTIMGRLKHRRRSSA